MLEDGEEEAPMPKPNVQAGEAPAKEETKAGKLDLGLPDLLDTPAAATESKKIEPATTMGMLEEVFGGIDKQPAAALIPSQPANIPVTQAQGAMPFSDDVFLRCILLTKFLSCLALTKVCLRIRQKRLQMSKFSSYLKQLLKHSQIKN